jgi:hypothetical protein
MNTAMCVSPKKPYTRAGFEPGSFAPLADAMTTAPRRHGTSYTYMHTSVVYVPMPV